jgi:hypothetical protein
MSFRLNISLNIKLCREKSHKIGKLTKFVFQSQCGCRRWCWHRAPTHFTQRSSSSATLYSRNVGETADRVNEYNQLTGLKRGYLAGRYDKPYATVDYIPQSGTMNLASAPPSLLQLIQPYVHLPLSRSRIHERTILLRLPGIILLRGGGGKSVSRDDCE